MTIAVVAVVTFALLFLAVRFVRAIREGYSGRAATSGRDTAASRASTPQREKSGMKRMLDEDLERRRRDDGRRASDQAAANARRIADDMAKRTRDRVQAETNRTTQNAIKRGRGW